jgi:hypothetical protein
MSHIYWAIHLVFFLLHSTGRDVLYGGHAHPSVYALELTLKLLGKLFLNLTLGTVLKVVCQFLFSGRVTVVGMSMSICEKTTTLIFLYLELVHHFINRKLVIQSQYIFQANPTPANFILLLLVTGHALSTTTSTSRSSYIAIDGQLASSSWCWTPLEQMTRFYISLSDIYFLSFFMWGTLCKERTGL